MGGLRLLSLERLESMNRRAINWAFPLLTVGLLLGVAIRVPGADVAEHELVRSQSSRDLGSVACRIAIGVSLRYAALPHDHRGDWPI